MAEAEGFEIGKAVIAVEPDTTGFEAVLRVIAKHATAAADELAQLRQDA